MGILMLLVFACVATTMLSEGIFVNSFNMQNIVRWSALFGIIGIGVAFVIITGGIDLSIGSMIGLIGCLMSLALMDWGLGVAETLIFVMFISILLGWFHGMLVTKASLQPFVVTLCGLLIYRGVARWITGDQTGGFGSEYNDSLRLLATGKPFSVAFVMGVGGLLGALWIGIRLLRSRQDVLNHVLAITFCAVLALIGASRFVNVSDATVLQISTYSSIEIATLSSDTDQIDYRKMQMGKTRNEQNPGQRGSALFPEVLLNFFGCLAILPFAWVTWIALKANAKSTLLSCFILTCTFGGVLLAQQVIGNRGPDWFGNSASGKVWNGRMDMLIVFTALAGLLFGLNRFIRPILKNTPHAKAPLILTGGLTVCWLMSQTPICRTLVPAPMIFLIVIAVLATIFMEHTIYGRYLLALGNNETATKLSGIHTDRMIILAYTICGACTGIGAILFALDGNSIQPAGHGNFYELYAIAAAVLGGCSLRGGEGSIPGVVVGAAVMRVLYNSINLLKIPTQLEFAIIGTVILVGVLADETVKRLKTHNKSLDDQTNIQENPLV